MTSSDPPVPATDPAPTTSSERPRPRSKARAGVALAAPLLVIAALLSSGGLPVLTGFAPPSPDDSSVPTAPTVTEAPTATPAGSPDATAETARPTLPAP